MNDLIPYIERVKTKMGFNTYVETMEYLGMPKQAWTTIQKGAGVNEDNAIRIAQALKIDPLEIMAISMRLRAKNRQAKSMWYRLSKKLKEIELSESSHI